MAFTQTATIPALVRQYWETRFLMRVTPQFVYNQFGQKGRVPKNGGSLVNWTRYYNLTAATTALSEGYNPTAASLSAATLQASCLQYGNVVQISDFIEETGLDNDIVGSAVDILADNAADSIDQIVRDVLVAGISANAIFASGVVARNSLAPTDVLTVKDVRRAVRKLKRSDAKTMADGNFIGIIHPDVAYDLQGDTNWVNAHTYTQPGAENLYNGEVGKLYGVRFLETTNAPVLVNSGSANTEVYENIFLGKEAYGVSDFHDLQIIIKKSDNNDTSNPLNMYGTVGWKAGFATKVLNSNFAVMVESGSNSAS